MAVRITKFGFFVLLCVSSSVRARTHLSSPLPIENGTCKNVVQPQGYECQEHKVTTKDGFILSLQRILQGRSGNSTNKIPLLLQHGILLDAASWLLNSPDKSLGFILADNGFDVWLANTRGTRYSRGHTYLDPILPAYWDWSWDELVAYDLPAFVEYVYGHTGQKLHYVGHSLGTLIAFAAFSDVKLVDMIRSAAMLSPIAYLGQIPSVVSKTAANLFLDQVVYWLGIKEFAPLGQPAAKVVEEICARNPTYNCFNLINFITGAEIWKTDTSFSFDRSQDLIASNSILKECNIFFYFSWELTQDAGPNCCVKPSEITILDKEPQSTATKNLVHLAQMVRKGTIEKFDYGIPYENVRHYGQFNPPAYDFSTVPKDFPLFLAYGGQDYLADVHDVRNLLSVLNDHNEDKLEVRYTENYAHLDYIWGENAKQVVYDPLIKFFENH